jgi:tRNA1Val (adenine37-N6)-methyltransferase
MWSSDPNIPREGETLDTLFHGCLKIIQPERGYRFSIDSILLAGLTRTHDTDRVVDLGTGCGVVSLILASQRSVAHITGIEVQESLVSLARRNVMINGLSHLVSIVHQDLRKVYKGVIDGPASLVVTNPPYRELQSGRLNPNTEKARARHELSANLQDVVRAAATLLPHKGRLALIYPARRLPHLLNEATRGGFAPRRLTVIHTSLNSEAKLVHLESIKGGGEELLVSKPFAIYQEEGSYTVEMAAMYQKTPVVS